MKSRTENKTVENKKDYIITMLHSALFVKTGVGEWTQLFLIQTIGRT